MRKHGSVTFYNLLVFVDPFMITCTNPVFANLFGELVILSVDFVLFKFIVERVVPDHFTVNTTVENNTAGTNTMHQSPIRKTPIVFSRR